MPKKFGINSKSAEARAVKDAKKVAEREEKLRKAEDEFWRDDDKHANKKIQRKEEKEQKHNAQLEKKRELQRLADEEMEKAAAEAKGHSAPSKASAPGTSTATKTTLAELERRREEREAAELRAAKEREERATKIVHLPEDEPLPEGNPNRMEDDEFSMARNVDEALQALNVEDSQGDRHPEKRVGAAYKAFEERVLPQLKAEFPSMRLSQLKQMCRKQFDNSPENPKRKL